MNLHELINQYICFRRSLGEVCDRNGRHLRSFARGFSPDTDVSEVGAESVDAFLYGAKPITSTWHVK